MQPGRSVLSEMSRIAIILFVVHALGVGQPVVPAHTRAGLGPAVLGGSGANPALHLDLPSIIPLPRAPALDRGPGSPPTEAVRPDSVRVARLLPRAPPAR